MHSNYMKIAEAINSSPYFVSAIGSRDVRLEELADIIKIIKKSKASDIKKNLECLYLHHPSTIKLKKSNARSSCDKFNEVRCTCFLPTHKECWYIEYINQDNQRDRSTKAYSDWREGVFKRDNYSCQKCGNHGGTLNAHHIKKYSKYPELRHVIENGITLCESCHKDLHREEKFT